MSNLSLRLASLRADSKPFTLETFLTIYSKAHKECYIDYMDGAKILHSWLTSDGKVPLDWEYEKYPEIRDESLKPPTLLDGGYSGREVAAIITEVHFNGWRSLGPANRAIFITMYKTVYPKSLKKAEG